jgi:hypothetical protein
MQHQRRGRGRNSYAAGGEVCNEPRSASFPIIQCGLAPPGHGVCILPAEYRRRMPGRPSQRQVAPDQVESVEGGLQRFGGIAEGAELRSDLRDASGKKVSKAG